MPHVSTASLSPDSALFDVLAPGDFLDCYSVESPCSAREAAEIITQFPSWVSALMSLRGRLVAPFGLANEAPEGVATVGPFPLISETPEEIVVGFNDSHLNFRISIRGHGGRVSIATWVHTHNLGGRAYLTAIMPFHILLSRNALARVARH